MVPELGTVATVVAAAGVTETGGVGIIWSPLAGAAIDRQRARSIPDDREDDKGTAGKKVRTSAQIAETDELARYCTYRTINSRVHGHLRVIAVRLETCRYQLRQTTVAFYRRTLVPTN